MEQELGQYRRENTVHLLLLLSESRILKMICLLLLTSLNQVRLSKQDTRG